jgi:SAM-dependent methyltransferase
MKNFKWLSTIRSKLEDIYLNRLGYASGKQFTETYIQQTQPGMVFLDAGCGEGKVRRFLHEEVHYIGIDLWRGKNPVGYQGWEHRPSVLGDLHHLPFADKSIDTVILLHVLEHVRGPEQVIREIARVMKSGGKLFLAVPFIHQVHHAPDDHHRFTRYALEQLFLSSGLNVLSIRPQGSYFRVLGKLFKDFSLLYKNRTVWRKIMLFPIFVFILFFRKVITLLEYPLDILIDAPEFTVGYLCIVQKGEK